MPLTCCVVQCTKRGNRDECSFYAIPSDRNLRGKFDPLKAERRARWLNAINRKDLKECMIKYSRVCQHHFISGHPAALNDVNNPDVPRNFKMSFGEKVAVIIDCFETFIERSSNPEALVQTWSNYKHHQTLKFLIGITPQGYISFILKAYGLYGGRASDTFITNDCGILNNLLPGDIVLADRGFLIENQVKVCMAELVRPTFLEGKTQLHPKDVESTRIIENVRIHVERVIGTIRQKYTKLHNVLPLTDVYDSQISDMCTIDKIVTICCALTNVCPSVVQID